MKIFDFPHELGEKHVLCIFLKETNLGLLALAEEHLSDGGKMIINGDNQVGVKSFLKNISNLLPAEITMIKKKGRIALYQKKTNYLGTGKNIKISTKIETGTILGLICFRQKK